MVIYALMKVFFGIVNGIVALFPKGTPPGFITSVTPLLHQVYAGAVGMGAWIPWTLAATVAGIVFTTWLVLVTISAVRWLVGWIPTMGGA